ncbi:MAG TPA: electron transport complex subunit RsxC [Rhizobiales bacterium]|nr:electron transport complex subunit RsxC [Hyphomicrobiales bacterium]
MKIFPIRGGVHPDEHKKPASERPVREAGIPALLHIPLLQHIGKPAIPVVEVGEPVTKGQIIGKADGFVSAPVHAPTSGVISSIGDFIAPHPSGLAGLTITLETDGKETWCELPPPLDPETTDPETLARRVRESGIVGMGGAAFPSSVKLSLGADHQLHTLVINGAECEPYLTADDRLMREQAVDILDGIGIVLRTTGIPRAIIAVEDNKPEATKALQKAIATGNSNEVVVEVVNVPARYPMGSEKHLIQAVTGIETPARKLPADIGVLMHNVATIFAIHEAVRFGRPLISRIVTLSGGAMASPGNLRVLIGTSIADLIASSGGYSGEAEITLLGGPMMGVPLHDPRAPVIKGTNGILALTREETHPGARLPCIRCAACVTACPCGLQPQEMSFRISRDKLDAAADIGLNDCILCGACAYVCPSHIPLVQYFNYARGALAEARRMKAHQDKMKALAEQHEQRLARIEAEKQAAREARKARMAEKRAKAAAAKEKAEKAAKEKEEQGVK